ncbi:MAG: leucyl aminopeptidase [Candidatus Colwellbacteria bacterium]|nr:leucyl aminopeptidase [Candidatus Colwellbacteria bacterium]
MNIKFTFATKIPKGFVRVRITESSDTETVIKNGKKEILVGAGPKKEMTGRKLQILPRKVIAAAKSAKVKNITLDLEDFDFPSLKIPKNEIAEIVGINLDLANFEFVKYKTKPKEGWGFVERVLVLGADKDEQKSIKRGVLVADYVNFCRKLANTPGGEMTPALLAKEIQKAAQGSGVKARVLGRRDMQRLKMGGVLGVAQGSVAEPKFIILEYSGGNKTDKPIVFVGKGITFDTGGLNLKPTSGIYEMHMDMSGGAAVASAVLLAAKLKLKKNVVALIPAAENMPSGSSYRPGDIIKTMSGKTIEVLNTDAEGRVVLSDALTYAERYNPALVVDVATLTGAAEVALGQRVSAVFSKDDKITAKLQGLGDESGDYVWPLPLWEEYEADIKGTFGDWANDAKNKFGGAITGAMFLYQFAKKYPWAHIDMAPRMTSIDGDYLAKGATGEPVRLLIKILEKY